MTEPTKSLTPDSPKNVDDEYGNVKVEKADTTVTADLNTVVKVLAIHMGFWGDLNELVDDAKQKGWI